MDYEAIKTMAKRGGRRVNDLLALAPQNDPFYTGQPAQLEAARWFADILESSGLADINGLHLRRVHYRLVSAVEPVIMPTGGQYGNTDTCWKYLCNAGKYARILEYVDGDSFVDRRNPDPIINVHYDGYGGRGPAWSVEDVYWPGVGLPDLPELKIPELDIDWPRLVVSSSSYDTRQYHVEVWAEKTTMNDELIPICGRQRVNLITGMGEMSWPAVIHFLQRAKKSGMPARILYVSDFDPAGLGMPISIARKIEHAQLNRREYADLDIALQPIILTADQVQQYQLPRTPVKDTDLRKDNWQSNHGEGAVELDALEALMPGVFGDIVTRAIGQYRDDSLSRRVSQVEDDFQDYLDRLTEDATADLAEDVTAIEKDYKVLTDNLTQLRDDLAAAMKPYRARLDKYETDLNKVNERTNALRGRMVEALSKVEVETTDYNAPSPDIAAENGTLYATGREYLDQLDYYKIYRESGQLVGAAKNGATYP